MAGIGFSKSTMLFIGLGIGALFGQSLTDRMKYGTGPYSYTHQQLRDSLPKPVFENDTALTRIYWKAWELLHIGKGDTINKFESYYLDEGFRDGIWQWDMCFMTQFAKYGYQVFPGAASLNSFYRRQEEDGHIPGILEGDGRRQAPSKESDWAIMPPLYAWAEYENFRITADTARLRYVFPILKKYHYWVKNNRRFPNGLYYSSGWGTGMDNSPRGYEAEKHGGVSVVCLTAQQGLAALYLRRIAALIGDAAGVKEFEGEYAIHKDLVNGKMWDDSAKSYADLTKTGTFSPARTIADFWPMLAGMADEKKLGFMKKDLQDTGKYWRKMVFPTLSASHPSYNRACGYWRGGVWAPTNYMVIKGLQQSGFDSLAYAASLKYAHGMEKVLDVKQADKNNTWVIYTNTIWENYSPDSTVGCQRRDFVGWSGIVTALIIESVIGLEVDAPANTVTWTLNRTDRFGLENLRFRGNKASFLAERRSSLSETPRLTVQARNPFTLVVKAGGKSYTAKVQAGTQTLTLTPGTPSAVGALSASAAKFKPRLFIPGDAVPPGLLPEGAAFTLTDIEGRVLHQGRGKAQLEEALQERKTRSGILILREAGGASL